jgi:hypothetical protein
MGGRKMSSKEEWIDAYEWLMESRIMEFFNKYQRYPNETEETVLESGITEDQIRDALASSRDTEGEDY